MALSTVAGISLEFVVNFLFRATGTHTWPHKVCCINCMYTDEYVIHKPAYVCLQYMVVYQCIVTTTGNIAFFLDGSSFSYIQVRRMSAGTAVWSASALGCKRFMCCSLDPRGVL